LAVTGISPIVTSRARVTAAPACTLSLYQNVVSDNPGCSGAAARLPNRPGNQKLIPPSSARAIVGGCTTRPAMIAVTAVTPERHAALRSPTRRAMCPLGHHGRWSIFVSGIARPPLATGSILVWRLGRHEARPSLRDELCCCVWLGGHAFQWDKGQPNERSRGCDWFLPNLHRRCEQSLGRFESHKKPRSPPIVQTVEPR
jgi:hypothetical protein